MLPWAFLPKNSPSLGKVTIFFWGPTRPPLPLPPYVQHLRPATLLLALSLRNFMGSHCIVLMYVYTILLRNTKGRSSWKVIAGVMSQWFWCKYFAHIFILCSKFSNKKPPATYTVPKHSCIPTLSCWCGLPMLRRKEWTLSLLLHFVMIWCPLHSMAMLLEIFTSRGKHQLLWLQMIR